MTKGHFEAKKHAYRQTQDGIVVSFVIHPNDLDAQFAIAPLGTRYMVGFAEIGDDGKPLGVAKLGALTPLGEEKAAKERRKFDTLPLSQQAAIRCNDRDFQEFLSEEFPAAWDRNKQAPIATLRDICLVESRAEFDKSGSAALEWTKVEELYQDWLTGKRYGDIRR